MVRRREQWPDGRTRRGSEPEEREAGPGPTGQEDIPDPRRGTRPEGPSGWIYDGLGYDRERHQFRGVGPKGYRRSDARICEDVCERLTDDDRIDASDIEVSVTDCEVFLRGRVSDRTIKRLTEDIAANVSGVRDVINELRIAR